MIGVLTASTGSGSVLGYDLGDKKKKDQRIQILASEGVYMDPELVDRLNQNWTDSASKKEFKKLSWYLANELSKQFDAQSSLSERIVKNTGHISLPFSPADRPKLSDKDFLVKLAVEYMEKMGITNTQYVITEHIVPEERAPHIHIAYNRVRFDGTVIDSRNERYRSMNVSRQISEKYGLTPAGVTPRLDERLSAKQQKFAWMRTQAVEALSRSCSLDEFQEELRNRGILLQISEHSEQKKSYGLSYAMINEPEISAKGSKLDRSRLSFAKVKDYLLDKQEMKEHQLNTDNNQESITTREDYISLSSAYDDISPVLNKEFEMVRDLWNLYNRVKLNEISLKKETEKICQDLREKNNESKRLFYEAQDAKAAEDMNHYAVAIVALVATLNPLAVLLILLFESLADDLNQDERISYTGKMALAEEMQEMHVKLTMLRQQQADVKEDKKKLLEQYLKAKEKVIVDKGLMNSDESLRTASKEAICRGADVMRRKYRRYRLDETEILYIVHSSGKHATVFYPTPDKEDSVKTLKKYDAVHQALKERYFMVGSDSTENFYNALALEDKYGNYRMGVIRVSPEGTVSLKDEIVVGDPKITAPGHYEVLPIFAELLPVEKTTSKPSEPSQDTTVKERPKPSEPKKKASPRKKGIIM